MSESRINFPEPKFSTAPEQRPERIVNLREKVQNLVPKTLKKNLKITRKSYVPNCVRIKNELS